MSLRFGSLPAVVGSSVDAARLILKTHDLSFIDRPRWAVGQYTGYSYSDMLWSPYGAYWLQARRLVKTELFSTARLREHESVRDGEVRAMLRGLYSSSPAGERRAVRLMDHLFTMNINVISLMLFSRKYISDDGGGDDGGAGSSTTKFEEFKWMIEEFFHDERRRREGQAFVAKDMVDLLLELADDPNLEAPIERNGVKAFTLNLLVGLPDTTSVTVEWAMAELLRRPDALAKVTEELDRVIGGDRHVTEGDIASLPYLEAVVKETMRLHPVSPLLSPRLSREDVATGGGHDIPAGTLVFVNVWAIGRDPAVWGEDAAVFRPERFAGSRVDVKGQDLELLPFGSGRRMCPGVSLGLRMVQVILASLLHAYTWRLPAGVEELNMEERYGLSMPRLVPLEAVPEPRLPAHLYAGP
nr:unnamed protein product [Digitaria exilis]